MNAKLREANSIGVFRFVLTIFVNHVNKYSGRVYLFREISSVGFIIELMF